MGAAPSKVNAAAQQAFAGMERKDLAAGQSALGVLEADPGAVAGQWSELDGHPRVAITDPTLKPAGGGNRRSIPL